MKAIYTMLIIFLATILFNAVRGDDDFIITHVLPFMGGRKPSIYDLAGLVMIIIAIATITRKPKDDEED